VRRAGAGLAVQAEALRAGPYGTSAVPGRWPLRPPSRCSTSRSGRTGPC